MALVPAYCTNQRCGLIFEPRAIGISNSTNITIRNATTKCPACGSMARLVEGTFDARGQGLEFVSGPPLTAAILKALQDIAKRALAQEITPQEAAREAEQLDPRLGAVLVKFFAIGGSAIALLANLIAAFIAYHAYDLQKADSAASAKFFEEAINLLKQQTDLLKKQQDNGRVDSDRRSPSGTESEEKPPPVKGPSTRRAEVRNARRKALKDRRRMFPRRSQNRSL